MSWASISQTRRKRSSSLMGAMKMEKTPFANRFAMLRDKFGTSWMLLHQPGST